MNRTSAPGRFKTIFLTYAVAFSLALGGSYLWKRGARSAEVSPVQVINTQPATVPVPAARVSAPTSAPDTVPQVQPQQADTTASTAPALVPSLTAWIVYAGQDIAAGQGKISLPTGARFSVKVQATANGQVAFHTINPEGISGEKALWTSQVQAGQPVTGPSLRLAGPTGLETLRVLFTPDGAGDALEQQLQIWHLSQ